MKDRLYSKGQVNRAGDVLRSAFADSHHARGTEALFEAFFILDWWRRQHARPLDTASNGLRTRCNTAGVNWVVAQRLKREPTIVSKLLREPGMNLSRMADLGGCRAIVADIESVRKVQERYMRRGNCKKIYDYIDMPKESGYRAVHLIVEYRQRLVEVQLRTEVQHNWAAMNEYLGKLMKLEVKSGEAPRLVLDFLSKVSEAQALEEFSRPVDKKLRQEIDTLRKHLRDYLRQLDQGGVT